MNFKHFLITQFNLLQFPLGKEIKQGGQWIEWTRERVQLFKQFCLPSLDMQTCKDFTWLIYFDKQTPNEFNDLIEELLKRDYVKVCFSKGNDGFMIDHITDIKSLSCNSEWIISSRIDNDDIFHKDAIKVIQDNFRPQDNYLISLTSGYTLNLETYKMGHYYYPNSPFISIIENKEKENLQSIYCKSHSHWEELKLKIFKELFKLNTKATFIIDKPYWIQVIHGNNVSNSDKRGFPVLKSKDLNDFAINSHSKKQSIFSIFSFYNYVHWKRYFRALFLKKCIPSLYLGYRKIN